MNQPYPKGGGQRPVEDRPPVPRSVLNAVKFMYAGAVISAIEFIISFTQLGSTERAIRQANPKATVAQLHSLYASAIAAQVIVGLGEVGLWVLVARLSLSGRYWARIVASVLFALNSVGLLITILRSGSPIAVLGVGVPWLAGLGAMAFLWRRESSEFFQPR